MVDDEHMSRSVHQAKPVHLVTWAAIDHLVAFVYNIEDFVTHGWTLRTSIV
jgi:hypothetical protein